MKILYARVSTIIQNLDRQLVGSEQYDKIFMEKVSGKDKSRPELQKMLCAVRQGDIVEVHSMDRLARNLKDLLEIVETIRREGATIHFKKENMTFTPNNDDPAQVLYLQVMGAIAQFERNLILTRQREGIEIAKLHLKYKKAHPRKKNKVEIENLLYDRQCGMTETELMNKYHISKSTLYRYLRK